MANKKEEEKKTTTTEEAAEEAKRQATGPEKSPALSDANTGRAAPGTPANASRAAWPPQRSPVRGSVDQRRSDGLGSDSHSNRQHHAYSPKSDPKHNLPPNDMPPLTNPSTYQQSDPSTYQQPGQQVSYHQPFKFHGYGYGAYPAAIPTVPYIITSGQSSRPPFLLTGQLDAIDRNRNFQLLADGSHAGPHFNQTWGHQQAFPPSDNMNMPHGAAHGPMISQVSQYAPASGYNDWSGYPEEAPDLGARIVKQIEYYFSDENLPTDYYLQNLQDEQGWVPIKKIADFNRVKKMMIDFILEALQRSNSIEVQGDKIRRLNDLPKWVPTSGHRPIQHSQPTEVQSTTTESTEVIKKNSLFTQGNNETAANDKHECLSGTTSDGECLTRNEQSEDNDKKFASEQLSATSSDGEDLTRNEQSEDGSGRLSNLEELSDGLIDDSKSSTKGHLPLNTRIDNEDNGMDVNDQDLQKLVNVSQESRIDENDRSGLEKESISNEEASIVDEALLFFEQLRAKHSGNQRHNSGTKVGDSKSSAHGNPSLNYKVNISGTDDLGHSHSLRQQTKGNNKSSSSSNQQFFQSNTRNHNSSHNDQGAASQSPPLGSFFGSAHAESDGPTLSKSSVLPDGFFSGSSPPVGYLPKSLTQFQHPSLKLLETIEFKQEKYDKFRKRCLSDRKNCGIGCSEKMNELYRFWSYFLRTEFKPHMYEEFKKLALEDEAAKCDYGIECLFRFYSYALETQFIEHLYDDFEKLTLEFYHKGNLYGLEKYWALHHYRDETDPPLKKNPELERLLSEEYRVLSDFTAKEKAHKAVR
ncbi:uncharacterized protein A4U43_C07F11350 [Asparagus officinalis]|uniref:HTH La-type RNA-binding domain-containing protein n=1 Tax=Asparagus officinalis TaxID=4686 RepID=A0A5P1EBE9_ASPOF|nr:la-related protein 1A-like isoform X2 [Asparagus officinalis]ONK63093.1 uncharacterized protein A4U43_C07F11350 [Asparagus officinalis]